MYTCLVAYSMFEKTTYLAARLPTEFLKQQQELRQDARSSCLPLAQKHLN